MRNTKTQKSNETESNKEMHRRHTKKKNNRKMERDLLGEEMREHQPWQDW